MSKYCLPVQWFPGHMTKARRMMEEQIRLVDVVVEMLDARIPRASTNPLLLQIIGNKPKIIAVNKIDMADSVATEAWVTKLSAVAPVVKVDCAKGRGIKQLLAAIEEAARPVLEKWLKKGVRNRSVRCMIVGVPNVGKSTLINRLVGRNKVVAQNRPGVTRGQQWVTIAKGLDLLDTPGVLWPKFEDESVGFALAVTGAVKDEVFDRTAAAEMLVSWFLENRPQALADFYNVELTDDNREMLMRIGRARGYLRAGGAVDVMKAETAVLRDFKEARIGKFTLDVV